MRWIVCRDREEELVEVARAIEATAGTAPLERTAVVFQRPLPYLYLARQVFPDAEIPYQALDALPLAAEPFAAALDLVFSFAHRGRHARDAGRAARRRRTGVSRSTGRSVGDARTSRRWMRGCATSSISADGIGWRRSRRSAELAIRQCRTRGKASQSARARGFAAARRPRTARDGRRAARRPARCRRCCAFVAAHERLPDPRDEWHGRHLRARAAILAALESLRDAHRLHDDEPVPLPELSNTVRRWIEGQTFSPRTGTRGLMLLDAPSAAYADVDELRLVGLVE